MASDPLASARHKLGRATFHLHALDEEVGAFANDEIERLRSERETQIGDVPPQAVWLRSPLGESDPLAQQFGNFLNLRRELPSRFGLILGDYLSNLRSALDHAANGVAGSKAGKRTKFPLTFNTQAWKDAIKGEELVGIPEPYRTFIASVQPHVGNRRAKRLGLLATLVNLDKHKVLHGVAFLMYKGIWGFSGGAQSGRVMFLDTGVLGDETKVEITFRSPYEAPKVEGGAPYQIGFGDGPIGKVNLKVSRVDLTVMLEEVRDVLAELGDIASQPPPP